MDIPFSIGYELQNGRYRVMPYLGYGYVYKLSAVTKSVLASNTSSVRGINPSPRSRYVEYKNLISSSVGAERGCSALRCLQPQSPTSGCIRHLSPSGSRMFSHHNENRDSVRGGVHYLPTGSVCDPRNEWVALLYGHEHLSSSYCDGNHLADIEASSLPRFVARQGVVPHG